MADRPLFPKTPRELLAMAICYAITYGPALLLIALCYVPQDVWTVALACSSWRG